MKNNILKAFLLILILQAFTAHTMLFSQGTINGEAEPCAGTSVFYTYNAPGAPSSGTFIGVDWSVNDQIVSSNAGFNYTPFFNTTESGTKTIKAVANIILMTKMAIRSLLTIKLH